VALKATGQGYILRDLSPIQNSEDIFLPGFSIPYAGRKIAELAGQDPESYWAENFARPLGACKAKILLRYGLQMITPNSQNFILQIDSTNFRTKRIIFRDVADSWFIKPVAKLMTRVKPPFRQEYARSRVVYPFLHPFSSNSSWRFDEGPTPFSWTTVQEWNKVQIESYLATFNRELGSEIVPFAYNDPRVNKFANAYNEFKKQLDEQAVIELDRQDLSTIAAMQEFIGSPAGDAALRHYFSREP
jgi:hypothetical protein